MIAAPNTGRRWALSPVGSRSDLFAEAGSAPTGMLVTDCGQLLPCAVDTSPHPPSELRCPTCARAAGQAVAQLPMSRAGAIPDLNPELVASMVLRRACDGGVAKVGDRYLDRGHSTPGYLVGTFDELINAGLLALADEDPYGFRRVSVTEAGRIRYVQLRDTRQPADLWVPEPRFPTTGPTAVGHRANTPAPAVGDALDPIRGRSPVMHWARCPAEGRVHAIEPTNTERATGPWLRREALCGHHLSAQGLAVQNVPSGALCLACVIGVTADMPDPGWMGTTQ